MIHRLRNCSGNNRGLTWPSHRDFIRVQPAEMSRSARTPYTAGKEAAYERRYELLRPSPRPSRGKLLDRGFGFQWVAPPSNPAYSNSMRSNQFFLFKSFLALNSRERFQEFFSFSSSSSSWSIGRDRLQWILDRDRGSKVCVVWQREGTNETLF